MLSCLDSLWPPASWPCIALKPGLSSLSQFWLIFTPRNACMWAVTWPRSDCIISTALLSSAACYNTHRSGSSKFGDSSQLASPPLKTLYGKTQYASSNLTENIHQAERKHKSEVVLIYEHQIKYTVKSGVLRNKKLCESGEGDIISIPMWQMRKLRLLKLSLI